MLHEYTQHDTEQCLKHSAIMFVGDSTVRQLFWAMVNKINDSGAQEMESTARKHSDATFEHENMKLQFLWDPYLNASFEPTLMGLDLHSDSPLNEALTVVVIGSGLWYAKHMEDQYLDTYKSQVRSLTDALSCAPRSVTKGAILPPAYRSRLNCTPMFLPVVQPDVRPSDESRLRTFAAERLDPMNKFLEDEASSGRIELFQSFGTMAQKHPAPFESDGLHLTDHLTWIQANMLLNLLCNSRTVMQKPPFDKTCCNIAPGNHIGGYIMVAFLIILLIAVNVKLRCVSATLQMYREHHAMKLVVLLLAVVYCFAADRSPLFEKINKPANLPGFVLLLVSGSICGLASKCRLPAETLPSEKNSTMTLGQKPFLSRQQSEEWKGWMQLIILLYHYFGMSKVLWVYQVARLLVASYLFMTGFGHTTYFLQTKDFSIHRVAAVLLRLNMLSCILGYVMLSSYDFYYFSVLCSFWFVVVFCTLGVGFGGDITATGITARCLGSILCVNCFIHIPGVLEELSTALHTLFRIDFHAQEFRFRVGLDLYVVYFGILVGWLYHKRQDANLYSWLDSYLRRTGWRHWATDNEGLLYSARDSLASLRLAWSMLARNVHLAMPHLAGWGRQRAAPSWHLQHKQCWRCFRKHDHHRVLSLDKLSREQSHQFSYCCGARVEGDYNFTWRCESCHGCLGHAGGCQLVARNTA
jgi:hypothetical protein